jgi:TrmH family RNA methyltransferase
MIKEISSAQNPAIKSLLSLQAKARNRKRDGIFVLEGVREIERAMACNYVIKQIFFNDEWVDSEIKKYDQEGRQLLKLTKPVFNKLAYREGVKNMVAIAEMKSILLKDIQLPKNPLIVVLETVEKPGNLGAILRSADGAGVDLVIVCDERVDIHNPNVIRNSLGGFFNVPIVQCSSKDAILFFVTNAIQILSTYLEASVPYYSIDMKKPTALVMGSEAFGISETWVKASAQNIIIPMQGVIDSLNVSNAASIIMFEAKRQREV